MQNFKWKNDTWLKPYLKKYKPVLFLTIFLGVLTFFCGAALMFSSGYSIDKAATQPPNILMIYIPILMTRVFGIGRPVFKYLERLVSHNWVLHVTSDLRKKLYDALEADSDPLSENYQTGSLLSLLAEDLGHLQNLYLRTIFPAITSYFFCLIVIIALGWFNLLFGLTILLLMLVELVVVPLFSVSLETARRAKQKALKSDLYANYTDQVLGAGVWKIADRKADFLNYTTETSKEMRSSHHKSNRFDWSRDFLLEVVFGLMAVALLYFTNKLLTGNQAQANFVGAIVLALFPMSDAIIPVSQGLEEWTTYKDSVVRLNNLHHSKKELTNQAELAPKDLKNISLENIKFTYKNEVNPIIKDFSLEIKRGEKVALIGPSGSGKTTILDLLLGDLKVDQGSISINGNDISSLQQNRSKLFSVLNQDTFLFNTTVYANLKMANPDVTDERIWEVLEQVQLKELFETLPEGLNTVVQEAGARFSGGQKQRLALARVLLQDTPIILLDEPTVGLDPLTEQKLLDLIFDALSDKTIFWITHHLQGIKYIDQVIFLKDGAVEMQGSPKELYQTNDHFKSLYLMDQGLLAQ